MRWSDSGDDLEKTMTRPADLSAAATAALTLEARYEIEAGFDYLYVQASTDGGTTWTTFDDTTGGEPFVRTASDQPATLHVNGRASLIRGQNAQPVFDDTRPYGFPEIPQTGVKVPDTGTRIRVASIDGTSMRIRVSSS
jgi:Immune inhibitor A peptidase M6